jgi:WD40 repeat protein
VRVRALDAPGPRWSNEAPGDAGNAIEPFAVSRDERTVAVSRHDRVAVVPIVEGAPTLDVSTNTNASVTWIDPSPAGSEWLVTSLRGVFVLEASGELRRLPLPERAEPLRALFSSAGDRAIALIEREGEHALVEWELARVRRDPSARVEHAVGVLGPASWAFSRVGDALFVQVGATAQLWTLDPSPRRAGQLTGLGSTGWVSPALDGRAFVAVEGAPGAGSGRVRVFAADGAPRTPLLWCGGAVTGVALHGERLIVTSQDGAVRTWDIAPRGPVVSAERGGSVHLVTDRLRAGPDVFQPAVTPEGHLLVSVRRGEFAVELRDARDLTSVGPRLQVAGIPLEASVWDGGVTVIALDGRPHGGRTIYRWDPGSGATLGEPMRVQSHEVLAPDTVLVEQEGELLLVQAGVVAWRRPLVGSLGGAVALDDRLLVLAGTRPESAAAFMGWTVSGRVSVLDRATGAELGALGSDTVTQVRRDPSGRLVATCDLAGAVRLHDAATLQELEPAMTHDEAVASVAFLSPRRVLVATTAGVQEELGIGRLRFHLRDAETGDLLATRGGDVMAVLGSLPGGRLVEGGFFADSVRLVDPRDLTTRAAFEHGTRVVGTGASEDGLLVVTLAEDGRVRVWSALDGHPASPWLAHARSGTDPGGLAAIVGDRVIASLGDAASVWTFPPAAGAPSELEREVARLAAHGLDRGGSLTPLGRGAIAALADADR